MMIIYGESGRNSQAAVRKQIGGVDRTVRTPDTEGVVVQSFTEDGTRSIRNVADILHQSKNTVQNILKVHISSASFIFKTSNTQRQITKMKKFFTLLVLFGCLGHVNCWTEQGHYKYIFVFGIIVVTSLIRHLGRVKFRIPIPYSIFVILCGILWGIGSNYVIWMKHYANVGESFVDHIHRVYLPVLVFSASFCTDVHTFLKSLPQILIISLPMAFLHACFCGLLMMVILDLDWSYVDGLMFGILFSTIYPMDLLNYFKQITGTHIKHLTVLLAGEMIISATLVLYVHEALNNNINGWVVHWYQFAMGIVRIVLLGIPLGYIVGFLGVFLMRLVSEEPICLMIITMSMCYLSFALCETIACAGTIGVLFSGMMMGLERMALPSDMEKLLSDIWIVIISTMNGLLFFITGIMIPINLGDRLGIGEYIYALVTYLLSNIGRFLTFLIFSPILKRIGYGFNRPNMVICVWGGLKNPLTLSIVLNVHDLYADDKYKACLFFMHLVIVYILFLIINGSSISFIFKAVGLSELSLAKQSNINNCMKYIYQVRDRTIAVLKMDRFVSDANWPLVVSATALNHPYKGAGFTEDFEDSLEDEDFLGYRFTVCPECRKNIPTEPTSKEMREMTREAKLRVLKLKKVAYSRQFESGIISKEGVRILHQTLDIAKDTEDATVDLQPLFKMFNKENSFYRCLKERLLSIFKSQEDSLSHPRMYWRYICFCIITHIWFKIFIYSIIFLNLIFVVYHFLNNSHQTSVQFLIIVSLDALFFTIYFVEFWITIFAYSWIYVCKHGFGTYFRSCWNLIDFVVLCSAFVSLLMELIVVGLIHQQDQEYYREMLYVVLSPMLLRVLRFVKLIKACKGFHDKIIQCLNVRIDRDRAMAYELGKNYVAANDEILENLHNIVDKDKIRQRIREQIERDRLSVIKMLGMASKERPWIAVTVKTNCAARAVLHSMREDIKDLKVSGWVDDAEFTKLTRSLLERYKLIRSIKTVEASTPREIFENISWMGDDKHLIDYLYDNVVIKKFDPGNVVVKEGTITEGIYILISAMLPDVIATFTRSARSFTMDERPIDLNKSGLTLECCISFCSIPDIPP
ncbi:hypothetical protein GEV33_009658 [Tenebrio molitor]|uniref:Sodium/hydrogen exchanger 10 n=1 Tax=Tenebrio molitor TaxID=7067 RepID=A0A8J6HEX2_TENMO|nr:hypothetical protein GEV33_009658 [Tenebrio molitor]